MKINLDALSVEDLATIEEMADRLELSVTDFVDWYNEDKEFRDFVSLLARYDILDNLLSSL